MSEIQASDELIKIPVRGNAVLEGELDINPKSRGLVLMLHSSGDHRKNQNINNIVEILRNKEFSTLLIDLLTPREDISYEYRYDYDFLTNRLTDITDWLFNQPKTRNLKIGYFGDLMGVAIAIKASVHYGSQIKALVSRSGRVDVTSEILDKLETPSLFIVGEFDSEILKWNDEAVKKIKCEKNLKIIKNANYTFEQPEQLEEIGTLASSWFERHLN